MRPLFFLSLLALLAACGDSEKSSPASGAPSAGSGGAAGALQGGSGGSGPSGSGGAEAGAAGENSSGSGGAQGGSGGSAGAGVVVRTVETRSPFGALLPETNLILDGDFEFSPASSIVPAWLGIKDQSEVVSVTYETGGRCENGVYCAKVPAGVTLANFAVALPPGGSVKASIRIQPAKGGCNGAAQVFLFTRILALDSGAELVPENSEPDAKGWCTFSAVLKVSKSVTSSAFYILTDATDLVVDHALISATTKSSNLNAVAPSPRAIEQARRLEHFRHRTLGPLTPQPPPPLRGGGGGAGGKRFE